jgi:hypothetical protein
MMNLNDRALLVQLNVSQWTARKYDKKVTQQVADTNSTGVEAGRYNKSLLPMNDYLKAVHQKTTEIRKKYYENTLPWGIEGTQLLPTANYLNFMTDFRKEKREWDTLVSGFMLNYDRLRTKARGFLGTLYNDDDYPTVGEVSHKFSIDMAVFPVPNADFRVSIASDELTRIQSDVEARVKEAGMVAMKEVWNRLFHHVEHIAERLADPAAIFRDSMLVSANETCDLLTRLNMLDDPHLEEMRAQVQSKLIGHHPESLRNDPDLRRDTAAEAKKIMDQMSVFMGGAA